MTTRFNLGDEVYVKPMNGQEGFVGTVYGILISVKGRVPNTYYFVDGLTVAESNLTFRNSARFNKSWQEWLDLSVAEREEEGLVFRDRHFKGGI